MNEYSLTPVQEVDGLRIKRDDLYAPFGPGFVYEKSAVATWGGIRLHPHYEAKTMQWFRSSGIAPESTLFWITGAEPRSPGQS